MLKPGRPSDFFHFSVNRVLVKKQLKNISFESQIVNKNANQAPEVSAEGFLTCLHPYVLKCRQPYGKFNADESCIKPQLRLGLAGRILLKLIRSVQSRSDRNIPQATPRYHMLG